MGNKKNQALISIVVPIFNSEKYLYFLLKSISTQSYKNIEIILINDGSSDDSELICKNFLKKEPRAKYVKQSNSGVSVARNKGIEESEGQFIYFIDSDDELFPESLSVLYKNLTDNQSDIAIGSYLKSDGKDESIVMSNALEESNLYIISILEGREHAALWNKLISKSLINQTRFNPKLSYMEDQVFLVEILQKNVRLSFTNTLVYKYRIHPATCTSNLTEKLVASRVMAVGIIIKLLKNKFTYRELNNYKANCVYFYILKTNHFDDFLFTEIKYELKSLNVSLFIKLILWLYYNDFKRVIYVIKYLKAKKHRLYN
jgi:glycosyltransferase involved in cell wall biosynthesis